MLLYLIFPYLKIKINNSYRLSAIQLSVVVVRVGFKSSKPLKNRGFWGQTQANAGRLVSMQGQAGNNSNLQRKVYKNKYLKIREIRVIRGYFFLYASFGS